VIRLLPPSDASPSSSTSYAGDLLLLFFPFSLLHCPQIKEACKLNRQLEERVVWTFHRPNCPM